MTNVDLIMYVCGSALGGVIGKSLIDKVINKHKDKLEIQIKEQVFYKTLITDITEQRNLEKVEIQELKDKIIELSEMISNIKKDNDGIIKKYESVIKEKNKQISKLFKEIKNI